MSCGVESSALRGMTHGVLMGDMGRRKRKEVLGKRRDVAASDVDVVWKAEGVVTP